jgi:hypothetical protein
VRDITPQLIRQQYPTDSCDNHKISTFGNDQSPFLSQAVKTDILLAIKIIIAGITYASYVIVVSLSLISILKAVSIAPGTSPAANFPSATPTVAKKTNDFTAFTPSNHSLSTQKYLWQLLQLYLFFKKLSSINEKLASSPQHLHLIDYLL